MSAPLIVVSSLEKTYATRGRTQVQALAGISFEIGAGEFITIVGQSGCGKTTLLKILAGLLQRSAGNVTLRGQPVDEAKALKDALNVFNARFMLQRVDNRPDTRFGIGTLAQWEKLKSIFTAQKFVQGTVPAADLYSAALVDQINKFDRAAIVAQAKAYKP